jgi:ribosomal protein L37AE/L43A
MPKINVDYEHNCTWCGDFVASERWALGKYSCMSCGEEIARRTRHTVAPMHKSNYMLITNREDLIGLNNKGGLVR